MWGGGRVMGEKSEGNRERGGRVIGREGAIKRE